MAQIQTLKDRESGKKVYPITSTKAVFDEKGVDLDALFLSLKQSTENALKDYAKKTEMTDALTGKQDNLATSEDLQITDGNLLSLTAMAKKRLFIDLWNEACIARKVWGYSVAQSYGCYNEKTGYFELNGLTDITYEEAIRIYNAGTLVSARTELTQQFNNNYEVRTNLPLKYHGGAILANYSFVNCSKIEVINGNGMDLYISAIFGCTVLRRVVSPVYMTKNIQNFLRCPLLEDIELIFRNSAELSVSFVDCPLLSLASVRYMIDCTQNNAAVFITVHPDVYAKLTDESNEEWHQLLISAAEKSINFATI